MISNILDGRKISAEIRSSIKEEVLKLKARGINPTLAVVLVGENPASKVYVRQKEKGCGETGITSRKYELPAETTHEELLSLVKKLNEDKEVHGILVQFPLPAHLNETEVLAVMNPEKDVDGFHALNVGKLVSGLPCFEPCTPKGVITLIESTGIPIEGKSAVVTGRSNIVGKPVASMLLARNATVTIAHSKTRNLQKVVAQADIVVAAIGKPRFITADMIKEGAIVIDVGINRLPEGIVGDVDFKEAARKASWITPVPGGVGPMTIAMLLQNTLLAAGKQGEN
ncbi:MAG: bifunctional methylenetetrahydrofolate dehydrogenase/methenyltetrahydrofolate cyclohydrolase FolD [Synergistaceae bacterium]|nr:bifunctional methylenetetrahydrofolate dehydrogenase/methenyltetrahydrofolate cyclohydrolase FolD [Synergistaceae bacterium]